MDSASDLYNSTLSGIIDKMIPSKTVRVHERPSDPWFDRECRTSKCLKRSLERIYMRTKSENDFAAWLSWVRRNSTKGCEDTSVEITGVINLMIQKTKRVKLGAILILSLVKKRDLLLVEFSLVNFNFFF